MRRGHSGARMADTVAPSRRGTDMAKFANILETVGNTPVVRIGKLAPPDVNLFV
jgi:hypothetical protein